MVSRLPDRSARRAALAAVLLSLPVLLAVSPLARAAEGPLASGQLLIQGSRLTLYADEQTNDADQVINVGERARVRTCFGGVDAPCGEVLPGDPRVAGLAVRAELRGPEVPDGLPLETLPGGTFVLPGFQQEGEYRLENIRLVEAATGRVLGAAEPSAALLHVREIVLTSATVRTLSLADLQARGITINQENFQAFDFAVGFAFGSEEVEIELPIVYDGLGTVQPLEEPEVSLDELPDDVVKMVERWQPPRIMPFVLERDEPDGPRLEEEKEVELTFPLFGAIVMPGSVSYLNQFFEAKLIVANGAPAGSDVQLADLGGSVRLPSGEVLRIVESDPSVAAGQRVPVVQQTGARILDPGEQGSAAWTVEGLAAGTHTLAIDVTGQILRPGRDPLPVLSRTQAAVEVVDARFNLTFSHPDVVREGEAYSLFVTVTNLSRATQNLITVDLDEQHMTGTHPADPDDPLRRTIETLEPGQAQTLEYRLVPELDGEVVATTFQSSSSAGQGTIELRTGVGELGIPLSPATLVLPRFSERLDTPYLPSGDFLRANVRFLGLAYSLAVAPAAHVPSGLPKVIRSDVERRAIDFGQAGHRTFLGEPLLETLEIFALDQLGNRHPLAEIDELRRRLSKGQAAAVELAKLLRREQESRNLGAVALLDHWAETASYTDPWLGAVLEPGGSGPAPALEIHRPTPSGFGVLAGTADRETVERTLPFGEMVAVREVGGGTATVPLALVGHLEPSETFEIVLRNDAGEPASGRLVVVLPDDDDPRSFRRLDLGTVDVPAGSSTTIEVGMALPSPASASERIVDRPPFRVIGAAQDFRLDETGPDYFGNFYRPNRYGNGLVYLFNRPPDEEVLDASAFRIRSEFEGLDTSGEPASGVAEKTGTAAFVQDDPRVLAVRYSTPVSALIDPSTGGPLLDQQQLVDTSRVIDTWGEPVDPNVPEPRLETAPLHVGGLLTGRVVRGTGEPAAGTKVELIRIWRKETQTGTKDILEKAGEITTGDDGRFFFDFVESPHWDPKVIDQYRLRATVPEGDDPDLEPADVEQIGSRIRLQNRLARVNIALLGRGVVTGQAVYQDTGEPVTDGSVSATSTLFNEQERVELEPDGSFRIGGVPVGPITLTARDGDGRSGYATVGVEEPGAAVDVRIEIPRAPPELGTVTGRVVRLSNGDPIPEARVAVYNNGHGVDGGLTDDYGRFRFDDVPAGQVTLQAAGWEASRSSVVTSISLAPGETRDVTLELPDGSTRTVTGTVVFHDAVSNTDVLVEGAVAFIEGPGVFAYTGADGRYRIEGVPVQGLKDSQYSVKVIDYARELQGSVPLPPITDATADVIEAQRIVLERMSGGVDGVVLDPLGRPLGGVEVYLYARQSTTSRPDGSFSFDGVPIGGHRVLAHVEDGLQAGRVGYFGQVETQVVYGGHRPFVTVRMVGSGSVTVHTTTSTATGILTPIYYKPTWFHDGSQKIKLKGSHIETSTDPNGDLELVLPVGEYEIVAYNPFHGVQTVNARIDFAGQTRHHEIVFEDAATVRGQVVDVDGKTPVPDVEVTLQAKGLLPQTQRTDAQGNFRFELVPKGQVIVSAAGPVGTVERVGRTIGRVTLGGQELDLEIQMKAQGSVRGQVLEELNGQLEPLAFAQYYVRENSYPYRRLPQDGSFFLTDAEGRYQVSHVYAGGVTVVARDSGQVRRTGRARGTLDTDWEVLDLPDIVMSTSVGSLEVLVRDPETGGPVADAQVKLSNGEWTVTDPEGLVYFDALALGNYSIYAFHAPTGRSGRLGGLSLATPGEHVSGTVYLDQRGEVRGTLYDDASRTVGVVGGIVRLSGRTAGGRVSALANTSGEAGQEGRFSFLGIPEGTFDLEAAVQTSSRRARAEATLTETAPVADVVMVLEPVRDVYVRLFERLTAGVSPVDLTSGLFSVRFQQNGYDFTRTGPEDGTDVFRFPDLLASRGATLTSQELSGEQRSAQTRFDDLQTASAPIDGDGTSADPFRLVLRPRGAVRVTVVDGAGALVAGADVTVRASGERFPSVTGTDGTVSFAGVPAGSLSASATSPTTGTGGRATGTLTYDDEVVELTVQLAPAVSAHGVVYEPVADDRYSGDPSDLVPASGIIVLIRDSNGETQTLLTGEDGTYRFDVLPTGGFSLEARSENGDQLATATGTLLGPDGHDNEIPGLLLDASPPRIVSIVPPPGLEGVSRTATVEIVFSELLHSQVVGSRIGRYFALEAADGSAPVGQWSALDTGQGFHVVRFVPTEPYANLTTHTLTISGGPGGVRDRLGRPLTASGDVGSNFKTSDGIGPEVIATDPSLDLPVEPGRPIRFDFNEAVQGPDEAFDGDGVDDAVALYGIDGSGSQVRLPISLYLTRSGYSVAIEAASGVSLPDDTLRRRVVVSGLTDTYGNPMPTYERTFRLYDSNPPVVEAVPYPDNAPDGQLVQGVDYVLLPVLGGLDDVTPDNPGGDVARVDFYFSDPTDSSNPVTPAYSASEAPFDYAFVGAYSGDGETPRPFPVWVQAVDTSTNRSNVVMVDMEVLPNTSPTVGSVTAQALEPVAGTFYAGSSVRATVTGLDDADGSRLTLSAELRADGRTEPIEDAPDRLVERPASGSWADLAPQTFDFQIPLDLPEGTPLFVRARAIDSQGAVGTLDSDRFPVADDATPARVLGLVAKLEDGSPETVFFIGETFYFELRAEDAETAVETVEAALDRTDLFPEPLTVSEVAGNPGLYRTSTVTVPVDGVDGEIPVTATVSVHDLGGNVAEETLPFTVAPEPDPTAPVGAWVTPRNGAPWPADYSSVVSSEGAALLLRVEASDALEDQNGDLVPGNLVSVRFRGPGRNPDTGELELASEWVDGRLVPGTDAPGQGTYQAVWRVPNGVAPGFDLPFEVEVVDGAGTVTVEQVRMVAAPARRVYEGVITAVAPSDEMLADGGDPLGGVFLLDGTTLSLRPQTDGSVRSLPAVHLYTGGAVDAGALTVRPSVLTAPEITTYDSAILYHPLELAVEEALTIGFGSRIDLSQRGLLGSTPTRELVLPGETGAQAWAGGSHGGRGGDGSPSGGWDRTDLTAPGTVYDSLRDPRLPGGGGASPDETPGGIGGGVARILAEGATVRLDGDLLADGGQGRGGGGAGGAIRLVAGRLEGAGRISASGGAGTNGSRAGGGGGGRIALSYRELGVDFDPATQILAAGGINDGPDPSSAQRRGGAGTIFLESLDATGQTTGPGRVRVTNPGDLRTTLTPLPALGDGTLASVDPALSEVVLDVPRVRGDLAGDALVLETRDGAGLGVFPILGQERIADSSAPEGFRVELRVEDSAGALDAVAAELAAGAPVAFHGRSRLETLAAAGEVRLLADDDLLLGGVDGSAPTLNDRARIDLAAPARVLLRGERPQVAFTATPEVGSEVLLGSELELSWQADDPLGLVETATTWSLDGTTDALRHDGEPRTVSDGPIALSIPLDAESGEVTYRVEATDLAGRSAQGTATWTVLPNEAPTVSVTLPPEATTPAPAGYPLPVAVQAADREGLAAVTLLASGPATPESQTLEVTGTATELGFEVEVAADADGSAPIVLQAVAEDLSGASTTSDGLSVEVAPNPVPTGTLALADGAAPRVKPGESTTVTVQASDPDGLETVELQVSGAAAEPVQTRTVSGTDVQETFTVTAAADAPLDSLLTATAVVTDRLGATFTTAALEIPVVGDTDAPVVTLTLDPDRARYTAGDTILVTASATDDVAVDSLFLTLEGETTTSDGAPIEISWTIPPISEETVFPIQAEALDPTGNRGTASRDVTADPLADDVPPEIAFTCPTGGALLPTGYELSLSAHATDDLGIAWVDFYADGATEPFAHVVPDAGAATGFDAVATHALPATAGETRIRAEVVDSGNNRNETEIVVRTTETVDLQPDGAGTNDWTALAGQTAVLRSGTLTLDQPRSLGGLIVLPGATVTRDGALAPETPLELDVSGAVYLACGGAIDVTALGYPRGTTYPDHQTPSGDSGGSHIGEGGEDGRLAETFGSVYRPREAGGGGTHGGTGGGVVRIVAERAHVDGEIRANGTYGREGAGGGSVWLTTETLAGAGSIEARGSRSYSGGYGAGGGGAIAVEYSTIESGTDPVELLSAATGSVGRRGGAGSIYLDGPTSTYGDLVLDNAGEPGVTVLPALGAGTAGAESGGAILATGRTEPIPAYFVGHWVEIYDGASGTLKGVARIDSLAGTSITLNTSLDVAPGDTWQGVYRFDDVRMTGGVTLQSDDPIRIGGEVTVASGTVTTDRIDAGGLRIQDGGVLTHPATSDPSDPPSLVIDVGDFVLESGGAIDVSVRGFSQGTTYPGHQLPSGDSGGSHIGRGGRDGALAETFGSVYRPQEPGGGGTHGGKGGGVVRIVADRAQVDGQIRANADYGREGGAGGSVWLTTEALAGVGSIEARGSRSYSGGYGSGGGGAIAVEYSTLEAGATLLDSLAAKTSIPGIPGGAGSVYVHGADSTYGDLTVDNGAVEGTTELPSLGAGVAQSGTAGAVLVTDLATPIPAYFVGHWVEVYDGTGETLKGTARVASINGAEITLDGSVDAAPGDLWQGIYRFDGVRMTGGVTLLSADPIRGSGAVTVAAGEVTADRIEGDSLLIETGGVLTHDPTTSSVESESLVIDVRELVIESGGAIDVTARGFAQGTSYPEHQLPSGDSGGSHIGQGGQDGALAETFGSVYRPQEPGGGGTHGGRGGGVVRIVAERARVDGVIRADGTYGREGGAGGSVWLATEVLAGAGSIEAVGSRSYSSGYGSGGGGAIAVEYSMLEAGTTLLDSLTATSSTPGRPGGAGSVYVHGADSTYGDLTVDNGGIEGVTELPSLGAGVAQSGTAGDVLVTDFPAPIPGYFVGHWVEVYDGTTGALKGSARIASIEASTVTLETSVDAAPDDLWQGIYRFDDVRLTGGVTLRSADPIRGGGAATVAAGEVKTARVEADSLRVEEGGVLTHESTVDSSAPETLSIDVRELVVESGGAIDVSGRGFTAGTTYPDHVAADGDSAGSHIGQGGQDGALAETFGSVYRPREPGGGGAHGGRGGGVVRIVAERAQVDGEIRATGTYGREGGAGGSIWLTTGALAGEGSIEALGSRSYSGGYGSGGGGAIAVEYSTVEAGTTLLDSLAATSATPGIRGGAGSVYVHGADSTYGDLTVDNGGIEGITVLPSFGAGVAQSGTSGAVLTTDLAAPIPAYFVGHWVEVYDGSTGALKGSARIVAIDQTTVTLEPSVDAAPGDLWQGIYRFDDVRLTGGVTLRSADPIRGTGAATVAAGEVKTDRIEADSLRIEGGGVLTHESTTDPTDPKTLRIDVRELVVESGGAIDVSGRGFTPGTTYPGHVAADGDSAGSHIGQGGQDGALAETFGSVQRPREPGGGGAHGGPGGGVVWITADRAQVDGVIRANGTYPREGGAGGSVWLTTGALAGTGSIEAQGSRAYSGGYGAGGGGAISVEYSTLETGTTLLDFLLAGTSDIGIPGGAGSVLVVGPGSTYGDLTVDNGGITGVTELPSLGSGVAQAGTAGAVIVTARTEAIPEYFVGHWVRVETPSRVIKGTWRIGSVDGTSFTLAPNDTETISIAEGDEWLGLYRVDSLTVTGGATLQSVDPVIELATGGLSAASAWGNVDAPAWNPSGITVSRGSEPGTYRVVLASDALSDADGIAEVRLGDGDHRVTASWSPAEGAVLEWTGAAERELTLVAIDRHGRVRRAATLPLDLSSVPLVAPSQGFDAAEGPNP